MPGQHPEGLGVARQIAVGQGGHGAPGSAGDHAQDQVITHAQVPAKPVVLTEASRFFRADDDIGPVALQVGLSVRAEFGDAVQGRGSEQVERREVHEGSRRGARADLDDFGRDLGFYPVAE
jgi:hypothetical protein